MKTLMLAVLVAGAAACGPPMKQTPIEEIPKLTKLSDVMDNQATVMDPLFKKIGTTTFTGNGKFQFSVSADVVA